MRALRTAASWLLVMTLTLLSSPAWACPYCIGRDKDAIAPTLVIVAMVAVPFVIVGVTALFIRGVNRRAGFQRDAMTGPETSEVC